MIMQVQAVSVSLRENEILSLVFAIFLHLSAIQDGKAQ